VVDRLTIRPGERHKLVIVAARQRRGARAEFLVWTDNHYSVLPAPSGLAVRLRAYLPLTERTIAELGFHDLKPQPPQACTVTRTADGYTIRPHSDNTLPLCDWRAEADYFVS
jgi:hypothetical protein